MTNGIFAFKFGTLYLYKGLLSNCADANLFTFSNNSRPAGKEFNVSLTRTAIFQKL